MNYQKVLVSGLVVGVISFFLGWLIWGILLVDLLTIEGMSAVMRPEADMIMWAMVVSNILWGILLAYIFVQANITSFQTGMVVGATLGFLIAGAFDFGFYAMTSMYTLEDIMKDVLVNTVFVGIIGGILGWWLGRSNSRTV